MFTYKFWGLELEDAPTQYYYGSLKLKPVIGTILTFDKTNNRYEVFRIDGKGLEGKADKSQEALAWAEIGGGEKVPTLWLRLLPKGRKIRIVESLEQKHVGRSFDADAVKEVSRRNRKRRLSRKISN